MVRRAIHRSGNEIEGSTSRAVPERGNNETRTTEHPHREPGSRITRCARPVEPGRNVPDCRGRLRLNAYRCVRDCEPSWCPWTAHRPPSTRCRTPSPSPAGPGRRWRWLTCTPPSRRPTSPELLGWHAGEYRVEPCRDYLEALAGRLAEASPVKVRPLLLRGYWPGGRAVRDGRLGGRPRGDGRAPPRVVVAAVVRERQRRGGPPLADPGPPRPRLDGAARPVARAAPRPGAGPARRHPRAERALGPAAALAALAGGECELLHVVRSRPYAVDWSLAYGRLVRQASRRIRRGPHVGTCTGSPSG